MSLPADEHKLIAQIVSGDQEAMRDLVSRYRPQIVQRLFAEGIVGQDQGDIVQEVLSAVFSQIQRGIFRGESSLGTWIVKIARGKAIDFKRSLQQHQKTVTDSMEALTVVRTSPSELACTADQESYLMVRQALALLRPQERTILELKEMDGYSVREIAGLSGLPEKRIYRLLERAREQFRLAISGQIIEGDRLLE